MLKLIILFSAFALVYGNGVSKTSRQGSLNKYYFYAKNDSMNGIPIPVDITGEENGDGGDSGDSGNDSGGGAGGDGGEDTEDNNSFEDHPLSIGNGKPTMVIVHGHGGDGYSAQLNPLVKNELFKGEHDYNVIIVDWSSYTKQSYAVAVSAVPSVGTSLGLFLKRLEDQRRIIATLTHLVGFNLGAHAVGYAARKMNTKPARITGLDPSQSQWGSGTPRLSKDDATYVEVIHTDGNGVLANGIGTAIGDVDFFVNGGGNQPGCFTHQCSHNRAYEVFAASLSRASKLEGNLCSSNLQVSLNTCRGPTTHIGGPEVVKTVVFGIYRVNTKRSFPY